MIKGAQDTAEQGSGQDSVIKRNMMGQEGPREQWQQVYKTFVFPCLDTISSLKTVTFVIKKMSYVYNGILCSHKKK